MALQQNMDSLLDVRLMEAEERMGKMVISTRKLAEEANLAAEQAKAMGSEGTSHLGPRKLGIKGFCEHSKLFIGGAGNEFVTESADSLSTGLVDEDAAGVCWSPTLVANRYA